MQKSLKYYDYATVFEEVPGHISLALNLTGCRHHCPGCHSRHLWQDTGIPLLPALPAFLTRYQGLVSCICFMGGEQNISQLLLAMFAAKREGYHICLYTGSPDIRRMVHYFGSLCDYIKVGEYDQQRGGLASPTTNQRMYALEHTGNTVTLTDITSTFFRSAQQTPAK